MKLHEYLKKFENIDPNMEVVLNDRRNNGKFFLNFHPYDIVYTANPTDKFIGWSQFEQTNRKTPIILLP